MSSPQVFHCGQLSLSWNVVSLDFQQQCSWLNQKPARQIPSFMSVSQWAAISMPPARAPERQEDGFGAKREGRKQKGFYFIQTLQRLIVQVSPCERRCVSCTITKCHTHLCALWHVYTDISTCQLNKTENYLLLLFNMFNSLTYLIIFMPFRKNMKKIK